MIGKKEKGEEMRRKNGDAVSGDKKKKNYNNQSDKILTK